MRHIGVLERAVELLRRVGCVRHVGRQSATPARRSQVHYSLKVEPVHSAEAKQHPPNDLRASPSSPQTRLAK